MSGKKNSAGKWPKLGLRPCVSQNERVEGKKVQYVRQTRAHVLMGSDCIYCWSTKGLTPAWSVFVRPSRQQLDGSGRQIKKKEKN